MPYLASPSYPFIQEAPFSYSPSSKTVYEVSLKAVSSSDWLKSLSGAHRLVQTLLQGELLGRYDLLDFLIWPEGLFTRIALQKNVSLSDFLQFLKEKSTPAYGQTPNFWDEHLQWIKLVPAEKISDSSRSFLQTARRIQGEVEQTGGFTPNLFFFYRNNRLIP